MALNLLMTCNDPGIVPSESQSTPVKKNKHAFKCHEVKTVAEAFY